MTMADTSRGLEDGRAGLSDPARTRQRVRGYGIAVLERGVERRDRARR